MSYRIRLTAATLVAAAAALSASDAGAQQASTPDSVTHRLPAIVSTPTEGLFGRVWNMQARRWEVVRLQQENRQLAHELKRYDRKVAQLEEKLDSLKAVEAEKQRQVIAIENAAAEVRARRLALEARLRAADEKVAKRGW